MEPVRKMDELGDAAPRHIAVLAALRAALARTGLEAHPLQLSWCAIAP